LGKGDFERYFEFLVKKIQSIHQEGRNGGTMDSDHVKLERVFLGGAGVSGWEVIQIPGKKSEGYGSMQTIIFTSREKKKKGGKAVNNDRC